MTTGKLYLEAKLMNNYEEELKYKETLIEKEIFESQDQLDFTQKFLQACVIPFPDLDQDKRLFKTYIRISEGLGSKLEVKRNQMNENNVLQKEGKVRRTPFQLWTDLFHSHPILKVALFFFTVHLILVLFTSLLRVLFYDQFLSMMIIGQMFIFVHFNILWAFKLAAGLLIQNGIDSVWLYYCAWEWWDAIYVDAHSLSYLRFLIVISSIALFFIRFVLIYLVIKLGYLKMVDDDDDLTSYAPEIKDLRIEPEFSQSDIRFSNFY